MAPSKDPSPQRQSSDNSTDLAQAYRDLARGEQAATALEANLNHLESKLDALLAAMDGMEEKKAASKKAKGSQSDSSETKTSTSKDEGNPGRAAEP